MYSSTVGTVDTHCVHSTAVLVHHYEYTYHSSAPLVQREYTNHSSTVPYSKKYLLYSTVQYKTVPYSKIGA